jgi:flavin-dependent dehydrogenase
LYDILVIGAGPTGSSAAKKLAESGYNVLIVEKSKLPRNKSCSGILIKKSIDLIELYFGESVPENIMCTPIESKGMVFINDYGEKYVFEQAGSNIWRDSFDYWLVQKALSKSAELRDETIVVNYLENNGFVSIKLKNKNKGEYSVKAKIVVDCSGAVCSLKRKLIHCPRNFVYTYQTFNVGTIDLDNNYFYAFLQPEFSEYDAWFNVKDNYLIFGVAVVNKTNFIEYYSKFVEYLKKEFNANINREEKFEKWIMPYILSGCKIDFGTGRIFFAGETAGFLNPMGEGISAGLESGFAVAKAIQQGNIHDGIEIIHTSYINNTIALRKYMESQWRFVASLSSKFSHMK